MTYFIRHSWRNGHRSYDIRYGTFVYPMLAKSEPENMSWKRFPTWKMKLEVKLYQLEAFFNAQHNSAFWACSLYIYKLWHTARCFFLCLMIWGFWCLQTRCLLVFVASDTALAVKIWVNFDRLRWVVGDTLVPCNAFFLYFFVLLWVARALIPRYAMFNLLAGHHLHAASSYELALTQGLRRLSLESFLDINLLCSLVLERAIVLHW